MTEATGCPGESGGSVQVATESLERRLEAAQRALEEKDAALRGLRDELDGIHRMKWWKLASLYWGLLTRIRGARYPVGKGERAGLAARPDATPAIVESPSGRAPRLDELNPGARKLAERFSRFRVSGKDRFFVALARHLSPYADTTVVDMYFEFAISTNERGRSAVRLIERYGSLAGKTALDVGCAYGGFVVAFSEAGAKAIGMDIDPDLLRLGRLNLEDQGVTAELLEADATSPEVARVHQARYDAIMCNDVIEHVEDPKALVGFIATALRPGGIAYLEIPNRNVPAFVLSDGHFQLFGIVLLERPEAARYYSIHAPGAPYRIGHYLELDAYRDLFAAEGLDLSVLPETLTGVTLEATLEGVRAVREALPGSLPGVPEVVRSLVERKALDYLETLDRFDRTTADERERFLLVYGPAFWKVLVQRREGKGL